MRTYGGWEPLVQDNQQINIQPVCFSLTCATVVEVHGCYFNRHTSTLNKHKTTYMWQDDDLTFSVKFSPRVFITHLIQLQCLNTRGPGQPIELKSNEHTLEALALEHNDRQSLCYMVIQACYRSSNELFGSIKTTSAPRLCDLRRSRKARWWNRGILAILYLYLRLKWHLRHCYRAHYVSIDHFQRLC